MSKRSCDSISSELENSDETIYDIFDLPSPHVVKKPKTMKISYNHLTIKIKKIILKIKNKNAPHFIIKEGEKLKELINASKLFCPEILYSNLKFPVIIHFVHSTITSTLWKVNIENKECTNYMSLEEELYNLEATKDSTSEPVKIVIESYLNIDITTILKVSENYNGNINDDSVESLIEKRNSIFVLTYHTVCNGIKRKISNSEKLILDKKKEALIDSECIIKNYIVEKKINSAKPPESYKDVVYFYEKFYRPSIEEERKHIKSYISKLKQNPELQTLLNDFIEIYEYLIDIDLSCVPEMIGDIACVVSMYDKFVLKTQNKLNALYEKIKLLTQNTYTTTDMINEKYSNILIRSKKGFKIREDIQKYEKDKIQDERLLKHFDINMDNYI
jgi:hypothetical protein